MSTLAEMRAEVLAHGPDIGPVFTVGDINEFLNQALRRLSRRINFHAEETAATITTVAGTSTYPWPTNMGRLRYLVDLDSQQALEPRPVRWFDEISPVSGRPEAYALLGESFVLHPIPDAAYQLTVRYWALPARMTSDSDEPGIPEDYHHLLPFWALKRCFEREDDGDMAAYWEARWEQGLREMEADVVFPSADGPRRVTSAWAGVRAWRPRIPRT